MLTINIKQECVRDIGYEEIGNYVKPGTSCRVSYVLGHLQPNYPVPAIREHYEFGWSLSDSQPVLMHVVQRRY